MSEYNPQYTKIRMSLEDQSRKLKKKLDQASQKKSQKNNKLQKKNSYTIGLELVAGFVIPIFVSLGIGNLLIFSPLWSIIIGVGFGILVNWIILYKMIKK